MTEKKITYVTEKHIQTFVETLTHTLVLLRATQGLSAEAVNVFGVPRGGIPLAAALVTQLRSVGVDAFQVWNAVYATIIVDDVLDSGCTQERYATLYPDTPFFVMFNKQVNDLGWIVFPWEIVDGVPTEPGKVEGVEDNVIRILQYIGEDPKREGLLETPSRYNKALGQWFSGYHNDIDSVFKVFTDGAEKYDEMVVVKDIPFYSHCEHHLAPFFGTATIAYVPNGKIVGLSKINRLVDHFARRLQVQERLTVQIADYLNDKLSPKGVGVVIKARHLCMESRGIRQQGHSTVTSALRGVLCEGSPRAEFLNLSQ